MNTRKPRYASRGFSLNELLITIIIIITLAGFSMLAFGSSTNNAQAAKILADLDAIQSALLTYSMENARRNVDPLASLSAATALTEASRHLDRKLGSDTLKGEFTYTSNDSGIMIGFKDIPADGRLQSALDRAVRKAGYTGSKGSGTYAVSLRLK